MDYRIGRTNRVKLVGFKDDDGTYPADATVTFTVFDAAGVVVPNLQDVAMPFVSGTTGAASLYRGTLTRALSLTLIENATYTTVVTAVKDGVPESFSDSGTASKG